MKLSKEHKSLLRDGGYFDAAAALHWYCVENHTGQNSDLYRIQCKLGYSPSPFERAPENGREWNSYPPFWHELNAGEIDPEDLLRAINAAQRMQSS